MTDGPSPGPPSNRLIIDPRAYVAPTACLVGNVTVGPLSSIWFGAVLRGDMEPIVIGARTNVQDLTMVHIDTGHPTRIGDGVTIGHRCVIHGATLGDGCLVGMGAIVLTGARIGAGALVAAGALIREGFEIPPGTLAAGLPAKILRDLTPEEKDRMVDNNAVYVDLARSYRAGAYR
jgi:carbonic anhydrase/acetyltransferase-like protein (isoleucine patch superfamily)